MKKYFRLIPALLFFLCAETKSQPYIIPVMFHVLHQGGSENISSAQVLDAMRILNEDYNKQNADTIDVIPYYQNNIADMQVDFRLATIDPSGNATNGIDRIYTSLTNSANDSSKINQWNPNRYLNIWVVKNILPNVIGGYSTYPWLVSDTFPNFDGVMILSTSTGSIGTSDTFKGRGITHLVGHYLCLLHLNGYGNMPNCNDGDSVVDTPPMELNSTCLPDTPYCVSGVPSNYQNFMQYSYCSRMFTNGQKARGA